MRHILRSGIHAVLAASVFCCLPGCPSSSNNQNAITQCTTNAQCAGGGRCDQAGFCVYPDSGVVDAGDAGKVDAGTTDAGDAGSTDAGDGGEADAGDAGTPDSGMVSMIVGTGGGSILNSSGTGVTIPAGAVTATTTITVTPSPASASPANVTVVGTPVIFGPSGLQFATPVTVTLAFSPSNLPPGTASSSVVIYTAPAESTTFTALTTTLADATHVSAQVSHFSLFVPGVPIMNTDAGPVDAGPIDSGPGDAGPVDAGLQDAGVTDAGSTSTDGGSVAGCAGCLPIVKGLRNPIDVKCHHGFSNTCFATELALDYSASANGREKLIPIQQGDNWGFPCCASANLPYTSVNPTPSCEGVSQDDDSFIIGNTPFGFDFEDSQFPAPWDRQVIIALHGTNSSWSGARLVAIGTDSVTGLPEPGTDISGGDSGAMADFVTGWDDGTFAHGRPADVDFSPDGRMFVANDTNGEIFWVAPIGSGTGTGLANPCGLSGSWVHNSSGWNVVGTDPAIAADSAADMPGHFEQIYPGTWLTVPNGFCAHHYATVPNARQIRFAPGGELFVASPTNGTTGGGPNGKSAIVVVPDDNSDGFGDSVLVFKSSLPDTQGMLFANSSFYFQADQTPASAATAGACSGGKGTAIWEEPYTSGQRVDNGQAQQIADITYNCDSLHWPKTLDMADDGTIYVGNGGSQGDACEQPGGTAASMPMKGSIVQLTP